MLILKEHQRPGYERLVEGVDESVGLHCFIAVHSTALGPALGGARVYPYQSQEAAIVDALRLAEGMTYKSSMAKLGLGGGKSVILGDPKRVKTPELLRAFGHAVDCLKGSYICAEDMGSNTEDMAIIRQSTQYVVGLERAGSSGNPAPFTAWGVYQGIKAALSMIFDTDAVAGRKVAVQGLGAVGARLAEILFWQGADLVLCDLDMDKTRKLATRLGAQVATPEEILQVPCDVLAPCSIGGCLHQDSIGLLRCRAIAGAANNQLLTIEDGEALLKREILYAPDFIINAGGIINVAFELEEGDYMAKNALAKVNGIYHTLKAVFQWAKERGISTSQAALELARQKVEFKDGRRQEPVHFHC